MSYSSREEEFLVLLYDLESYGGTGRAPWYRRGDTRFFLNAYARRAGQLFHALAWTASAETIARARSLVPSGGVYFDRTGNFPSLMVPIEGWRWNSVAPATSGPAGGGT